jgi:hypothetical protein
MTDENKLIRDTGRALRARHLLDDELLAEAFSTLDARYTAAWRNTHIDDVNGREHLFKAINLVGKVREHLEAVLVSGKLAEAELKSLQLNRERKKRRA